MDWKDRFNRHSEQFSDTEFLQHVSKTVNGVAISEHQFSAIVDSIADAIRLGPEYNLLDLCCGNGIVTRHLAKLCGSVDAVDFSESLIRIAKKHNQEKNINYFLGSILELDKVLGRSRGSYESICMYEALQCFGPHELRALLSVLRPYCKVDSHLFFGSIPDVDRIWNFYDTPERRAEYHCRMQNGTEAIGTWWHREYISFISEATGFASEFRAQPEILHTAHYRFDLLLKPN